MSRRPRDIGTVRKVQHAVHKCACGCGEHPRRWDAEYVAGHRPPKSLEERLWARVIKADNGCWEWQGFRGPYGHGQIGRGRRSEGIDATHRVAWEVTHGPIPKGLVVRHRCDNPPCCNPDHLELGEQADNVKDMISRGRQATGKSLPQTKLTDAQIIEIRMAAASGELQREIAARFGVTQGYISTLISGFYRKAAK